MKEPLYISSEGILQRKENTLYFVNKEGKKPLPVSEELSSVETQTFELHAIFPYTVSEELSSVETGSTRHGSSTQHGVSEELSSVETRLYSKVRNICGVVSEELSSVETLNGKRNIGEGNRRFRRT